MPFDGEFSSNVVLERLHILHELCSARHWSRQGWWNTCLWSEARCDKRLRAHGIQSSGVMGRDRTPGSSAAEFFGLTHQEASIVFSYYPKQEKLPVIERALKRLEAEVGR
jgi:hypothetical protein